jgi:hypothetical protein
MHLVRALERGRRGRVSHNAGRPRRAPCAAQIGDRAPEGVTLASRPRFTPTFIVIQDGTEIGRIEGYPGEDFFWGLLGRILERGAPNG